MTVYINFCISCILIVNIFSTLIDCSSETESKKKQPHIILIVADDLVSTYTYCDYKYLIATTYLVAISLSSRFKLNLQYNCNIHN